MILEENSLILATMVADFFINLLMSGSMILTKNTAYWKMFCSKFRTS